MSYISIYICLCCSDHQLINTTTWVNLFNNNLFYLSSASKCPIKFFRL